MMWHPLFLPQLIPSGPLAQNSAIKPLVLSELILENGWDVVIPLTFLSKLGVAADYAPRIRTLGIQVVTFSPFDLDVFRKNPAQIISGTRTSKARSGWGPTAMAKLLPCFTAKRKASATPRKKPSSFTFSEYFSIILSVKSFGNSPGLHMAKKWQKHVQHVLNLLGSSEYPSWALKISKESKSDRCCHQLSL